MSLEVTIDSLLNDLKEKITPLHPIIECIANSLEANANNITIVFSIKNALINGIEEVDSFKIIDNGDGFTNDNLESFKIYKTTKKQKIGCKGIGRLTWLKVTNRVDIDSIVEENNELIKKSFQFDKNFDTKVIPKEEILKNKESKKQTTICFCNLAATKDVLKFDPNKIKELVFINLLPKLILLKRNFEIRISKTSEENIVETITEKDIPKLESIKFKIDKKLDETNKFSHEFELWFALFEFGDNSEEKLVKKTIAYYCANGRAVNPFKDKGIEIQLGTGKSGIFLLSSKYFDNNDDDMRNNININDNEETMIQPITWLDINNELRNIIYEILHKKWTNIEKENIETKEELSEEYPQYTKYIKQFKSLGIISRGEVIDKSEELLNKDKKEVRSKYTDLLKTNLVDDNFLDQFDALVKSTTELSKQELAEYIWYRKIIIDALGKMKDDKEKIEGKIHDLIIQRGAEGNYSTIEQNNLWLLDDKYSLYEYVASDKQIQKIIKSIDPDNGDVRHMHSKKEPDIAMFFPENPEGSNNDLKAVVIELKAFGVSADRKISGTAQLRKYIRTIQEMSPKVKQLWAYLITDFDDDLKQQLKDEDFKLMFTHGEDSYYKFYENLNVIVSVLSVDSLIADASARNDSFLQIISNSLKV